MFLAASNKVPKDTIYISKVSVMCAHNNSSSLKLGALFLFEWLIVEC